MNKFKQNITNIYQEKGKIWLNELPKIVEDIAQKWRLKDLKPVNNLTHNYLLSGFLNTQPIILKIGLDTLSISQEARALKAFNNFGAAEVIKHEDGTLLLSRATPGNLLKSHHLKLNNHATYIACNVMQKLHQAPLITNDFPHIRDWLKKLDNNFDIPNNYLQKARILRDKLLKSGIHKEILLHGDLHHENIIQHHDNWIAIDPKGVIGYPINEVWAFIMDIEKDSEVIANFFDLNVQEIRDWYFVHLTLAICWCLEDNIDAKHLLKIMDKAYKYTQLT